MIHDHTPFRVDHHPLDCGCCAQGDDRLDAVALGKIAVLGAVTGTAIAFALDPAGAAAALLSVIGL